MVLLHLVGGLHWHALILRIKTAKETYISASTEGNIVLHSGHSEQVHIIERYLVITFNICLNMFPCVFKTKSSPINLCFLNIASL